MGEIVKGDQTWTQRSIRVVMLAYGACNRKVKMRLIRGAESRDELAVWA